MASNIDQGNGILSSLLAGLLSALAYIGVWMVKKINKHGEENRERIQLLEGKIEELSGHERECLRRVAELEARCVACPSRVAAE